MHASEHARLLLDQGYTIVRNAAPAEQIKTVQAELAAYLAQTPACEGDFYGWKTVRIGAILKKSPTSHALALHPTIMSLAEAALGPHCDWFQLNLSQLIALHPGQTMQAPHRDHDMWHGAAKTDIEYQINVIWPLTPFTPENGGTVLWPGTHKRREAQDLPPLDQSIAATANPGDALVYLGSLVHCGGANRTDKPREGLVMSYSLGWLKSYENNFLAYPPEVARHFSAQMQDLLGYRIHRPNLGNYEGQSPALLLQDGAVTGRAKDELLPAQVELVRAWRNAMEQQALA